MIFNRPLLFISLIALTLLAACSLAEDITPPPEVVATAAPLPTATFPPDPTHPTELPSAGRGALIYAQNCTGCHGVSGKGDGDFASQILFPVPAFATDPQLSLATTPARWFSIITNGNLERVMPPWRESISESERWDLVAYLYTLGAPEDMRVQGDQLYEANCAQCHAADGAGEGTPDMPNFTNLEYMATTSNESLMASLNGNMAAHADLPTLAEDEQLAVISFVRAFSFDSAPVAIPTGNVIGTVTNGTAGSALPADLPVVLHLFDNFRETETITVTAQSDGTFAFPDVQLTNNQALIVSVRHNGVLYTSDIASASPAQSGYDLPVRIYDTTTHQSSIQVERLHVIFEFERDLVRVGQLFIVSNLGNKTVVGETTSAPVLAFSLPSGFSDLSFQDEAPGERFITTADGFADTLPVPPNAGTYQILVSYTLPYTDRLTFEQRLRYPTAGFNILLPDGGPSLSGPSISEQGTRDVQGAQYRVYASGALEAGDSLTLTISGKPALASSQPLTFNLRNALIGGLSVLLALAIAAFFWAQRRELAAPPPHEPASADELLNELATLDDEFAAGKIDEAVYASRREALKRQLRQTLSQRH